MTTFTDQLKLEIIVDPSGAVSVLKGFGQQTTAELEVAQSAAGAGGTAAGTAYGTNFANTALLGVQALASAAASLGITSFARSAISDADEFLRANVQLDAELKAVGASAGVTEQSINALASSLQKSQDVYAGVVKQGAALLLTFTAIQNQPGPGNDIFNRALTDATAISNVFKRDLPTSITQLGRALEDPLTGIVSLQRGGLAISEQDKQRIRDLAKQGDLLGAQNALLTAIENKGIIAAGAEAGSKDPAQRFATDLETAKVALGRDFLPVLSALDTGLEAVGSAFGTLPGPMRETVGIAAGVVVAFGGVAASFLSVRAAIQAVQALRASASAGLGAGGAAAAEVVPVAEIQAFNVAAAQAAGETGVLATGLASVAESGAAFAVDAQGTVTAVDELIVAGNTFNATGASMLEVFAALGGATLEDDAAFAGMVDELSGLDAVTAGAATGLGTLTLEMSAATESSFTFAGAIASVQATISGLDLSAASLLPVLGAVGIAFAGLTVENIFTRPKTTSFSDLHNNMQQLLGDAHDLEGLDGNRVAGFFHVLTGGITQFRQDKQDVKDLKDYFVQLAQSDGIDAAERALSSFKDEATAAGFSVKDTNEVLTQANTALNAIAIAADNAAAGAQGFDTQFATLAQGAVDTASDNTALAQSFVSIQEAKDKLAQDKADIAGTGLNAVAAVQAESNAYDQLKSAVEGVTSAKQSLADAYHTLDDAQQTVTSSARTLLEAQQALAEFNSARGVEERALETDIINRRVVTTPAEEDQKRLDLLQQQDSTQRKQQSLQDAVTNAQKAYADAIYAVGKAQRDIVKDQQAVADATDKVGVAEKALQAAIQKRQQVAHDAALAEVKDQLARDAAVEQTASKLITMAQNGKLVNDTWLKGLKAVADELLPGGEFKSALDAALGESILTYELGQAGQGNTDTGQFKGRNFNPGSTQASGGPNAGLDPGIVKLLHALGIPGFDTGGIVPGALGTPQLAVVHGGERVQTPAQQQSEKSGPTIHQENHFYGNADADLHWANAQLAWGVARYGRGS